MGGQSKKPDLNRNDVLYKTQRCVLGDYQQRDVNFDPYWMYAPFVSHESICNLLGQEIFLQQNCLRKGYFQRLIVHKYRLSCVYRTTSAFFRERDKTRVYLQTYKIKCTRLIKLEKSGAGCRQINSSYATLSNRKATRERFSIDKSTEKTISTVAVSYAAFALRCAQFLEASETKNFATIWRHGL